MAISISYLLARSATVNIMIGNGDGTFQTEAGYPSGSGTSPIAIASGDVNGDGQPDLVITESVATQFSHNTMSVLLGTCHP